MKKPLALIAAAAATITTAFGFTGCAITEGEPVKKLTPNYAAEAYEFVKYIDANLNDRDCLYGENFKGVQDWIIDNLKSAGYTDENIQKEPFEMTKFIKEANLEGLVGEYTTDGEKYKKEGWWSYVPDANGEYVNATITSENIIVKKEGKGDKQIIVGMHYDGTGTGDNGSGIALGLITAMKFCKITTEYDLKFVFFSGEEYGLYGSTANAYNMSEEEIAATEYMINMDSLVCGDYCYLYGGVQDDENKTVTQTEAYDNAMAVAEDLGLVFMSNPWSYTNPTPSEDYLADPEADELPLPDFAAPSTGDWSDHVGYKEVGIPYLYFEATNWTLGPDYDGYQETADFGPLMNTENDYLEKIEELFPGRIQKHLTQFSTLLNALLMQTTSIYA